MTQTTEQLDNSIAVVPLPVKKIYGDEDFNIRGHIQMGNVVELARNINKHGLLQPISVRSWKGKEGYDWRVIVGHRRLAAFQHLQREFIPCIIRENISEVDEIALNFIENVAREDLNILQEAYGVQRLTSRRLKVEDIAKLINKGKKWVEVRVALLKMPEPIQNDAAAGFLTQGQILDLSSINDPDRQLDLVRKIKEAKLNNESRLPKIKEKKRNPTALKRRQPEDIYEMINHLIDETGDKSEVVTRTLAWVNGEISDLDLYRDYMEFFKSRDVLYAPPMEVRHLLAAIKRPEDK